MDKNAFRKSSSYILKALQRKREYTVLTSTSRQFPLFDERLFADGVPKPQNEGDDFCSASGPGVTEAVISAWAWGCCSRP
jgi:hypothetical protein